MNEERILNEIPRARAIEMMSDNEPLLSDTVSELKKQSELDIYKRACTSDPLFTPDAYIHEYSDKTNAVQKKFLDKNGELKWNLVHGKGRKRIKFAIKKANKKIDKFRELWNKYAGKKDVACVRARIGGYYWDKQDIENKPWFLEKVDDWFDETYCYIFCKIDDKPTQ